MNDEIPVTLGENVGRYVPMYIGEDELAYIFRNTDFAPKEYAGLSKYSGNAGDRISLIRNGEITYKNWNWSLATRYLFVGDGALTQTRPILGRVIKIGYIIKRDKIFLSAPLIDIKLY